MIKQGHQYSDQPSSVGYGGASIVNYMTLATDDNAGLGAKPVVLTLATGFVSFTCWQLRIHVGKRMDEGEDSNVDLGNLLRLIHMLPATHTLMLMFFQCQASFSLLSTYAIPGTEPCVHCNLL